MTTPCPVCNSPSAPPAANATHPFCSDRCRMIDLSAWLGERYTIPGEPVPQGPNHHDAEDVSEDD
jgi:endogenous inhibitor of DNA gyrase (YacG/DUF329 family)